MIATQIEWLPKFGQAVGGSIDWHYLSKERGNCECLKFKTNAEFFY